MDEILIDINNVDENGVYSLPDNCPEIISLFKIIDSAPNFLNQYGINSYSKKLKTLIIPDHVKKVQCIHGLPDIEKIVVGRGVNEYFDENYTSSKAKIVEFLERNNANNVPINISFYRNQHINKIIKNNNKFIFKSFDHIGYRQPAVSFAGCLSLQTPIYSDICDVYHHYDQPLFNYRQTEKHLRCIPYASYMNSGIKGIIIPPDIAYIGRRAFQCCKNLEYVIITGNTVIGFDAFAECPNLKGIAFLDSRSFLNCEQFLSPQPNDCSEPISVPHVWLSQHPSIDIHTFHGLVDSRETMGPTYEDLRGFLIDTQIIGFTPNEKENLINDFKRWQEGENIEPFQSIYDRAYPSFKL
jgi:hypothetical protein